MIFIIKFLESGEQICCSEHCVTELNSNGSYMWQVLVVGGLWLQQVMQYVCLSQCVNVCTLLKNISVSRSVLPCVHMYECVRIWGS